MNTVLENKYAADEKKVASKQFHTILQVAIVIFSEVIYIYKCNNFSYGKNVGDKQTRWYRFSQFLFTK